MKKAISLLLVYSFTLTNCTHSSVLREPSAAVSTEKSGYVFDPKDTSCDGYPRVKIESMPGTCVGMVLPRERAINPTSGKQVVMPRNLIQIPNSTDFLVVDMGGWKKNNGSLFLLTKNKSGMYELKNLKANLNMPHGLALGPDGFFYIGESHQIWRFHILNQQVLDAQLVVSDLPRFEGHMHPLTQFTFDPVTGDMFINSGAPSDHCFVEKTGTYAMCPEVHTKGLAGIYQIKGEHLKNLPPKGVRFYTVLAQGLRNSMAMVVHPSGHLLQGENSRDFSELEEPHEEMNVIDTRNIQNQTRYYGWPYCYNFHATSPEWLFPENKNSPLAQLKMPYDCKEEYSEMGGYYKPHILMPPHSAPLSMIYYSGKMFPQLKDKLLVTWHGYQPTGHRIVAYETDSNGLPIIQKDVANASFMMDQPNGCPVKRKMSAQGGVDQYSQYTEVISGWSAVKGVRPKGAPVSITEADDGSIWVVEDRENRSILRIARSLNTYSDGCDKSASPTNKSPADDYRVNLLAWRNQILSNSTNLNQYQAVQGKLIQRYCVGCHGDVKVNDIRLDRFSNLDFLVKNEWFEGKNSSRSKIVGAITQNGEQPPMPPGGAAQFHGTAEGLDIVKAVNQWIDGLPAKEDIEKRVKQVSLNGERRLRDKPSAESGKVCGQFSNGDIIYIDPRPESQVKASGWIWAKTYVVPDHSRLFYQACSYPEDGVFWMAINKL